jgi:hypothetical protein
MYVCRPFPFFFLNFKGTRVQEENKTILSSLKIFKKALSNQIDFLAFFHLWNTTIRYHLCSVRWPSVVMFRRLTFRKLTDCGKSI